MRAEHPKLEAGLAALGIDVRSGTSLSELTSLGIGGTTDLLRITKHDSIPELIGLLEHHDIPYKFLGGGSNLLVGDGELPWVILQLAKPDPEIVLEGNFAHVDAAADLGRTVTFCAKHDLGGMEGLIGVPGTVGGALRMNAGAYGMQIGSYVRKVKLYRAAERKIEILSGEQISFEYRHTSFGPDDMMLAVTLELPSKPFKEILQGIRICNEKRRSSQPLGQKSAGCIFKNPPGASAGRMIDELGLKGLSVGDAKELARLANSFLRDPNVLFIAAYGNGTRPLAFAYRDPVAWDQFRQGVVDIERCVVGTSEVERTGETDEFDGAAAVFLGGFA